MIVSIGSSLPSFKRIVFHEGLNVLLSDTHPGASEKQTRNSAGKTSLIEVIHFLLGADCLKGSLFRSSDLLSHSFFCEFSLGGHVVSVERTGSRPSRIYVDGRFEGRSDLPMRVDKESDREYLSNVNWKAFLGHHWFALPLGLQASIFGDPYTPSFRSMISYFVRRHQSRAFISPERQAEKQQQWDWQENLSYIFGLDWRLPYELQKIRVRERALEELRESGKRGRLWRDYRDCC